MSDGDLRKLFKANMPTAHWQPIETWSTGQGTPDAEYCFAGGRSGWIENKKTINYSVKLEPEQVAWLERRCRVNGRCFVAVRRQVPAGPRRGPACDELWLFHGSSARGLMLGGMQAAGIVALSVMAGGPSRWNWRSLELILRA